MTTPIDPFERRLPGAFTDLAEARTPDYLIDILGQTARTRQRPAWAIPGRWNPMLNLTNRPALALLTVVLLSALVGGGILLNRGRQPGVGEPSEATPTVLPSPSPSPTTLGNRSIGQQLEAGTYRVGEPNGLPFRFTVTSDWRVLGLQAGDYIMYSGPDWATSYLAIALFENVYPDPCRTRTALLASPAPTTVDAIVAALGAMENFAVSNVTDIVIDGHAGKRFDLTNSLDPETAACDAGRAVPLFTFRDGGAFACGTDGGAICSPTGITVQMAVVDVDGTPVAIAWTLPSDGPVDEVLTSIDFE